MTTTEHESTTTKPRYSVREALPKGHTRSRHALSASASEINGAYEAAWQLYKMTLGDIEVIDHEEGDEFVLFTLRVEWNEEA